MLRLIHTQTTAGSLLVNDIDDGLPNKTAKRLGGSGDPKKYVRDGYANKVKQACYVTRSSKHDTSLPGYIDLLETDRVLMSRGKGTIKGFRAAGLISVVEFDAAAILTPTLATADLDAPGVGDLTLTGTKFESVAPEVTSVIITGTAAVTLTAAAIVLGGGSVTATSIVIPAALVPGVAAATSFAQVKANAKLSPVVALS